MHLRSVVDHSARLVVDQRGRGERIDGLLRPSLLGSLVNVLLQYPNVGLLYKSAVGLTCRFADVTRWQDDIARELTLELFRPDAEAVHQVHIRLGHLLPLLLLEDGKTLTDCLEGFSRL